MLIIVPVYKKGDKKGCNNYSGVTHLPTIHKIFSNILLSMLTAYGEKIIGDHQWGF
jgi:hypothetical protein